MSLFSLYFMDMELPPNTETLDRLVDLYSKDPSDELLDVILRLNTFLFGKFL